MDTRLQEFADLLRQNGLRVSPVELADANRAALLLPLDHKPTFRAGLRATLVKRGADAAVFDRLFELYFGGVADLLAGLTTSLLEELAAEQLDSAMLEQIARALADSPFAPVSAALLRGDASALSRLLRGATLSIDFRGLASPLQRGFYARRLLHAAGATAGEQELQRFLAGLRARGLEPGTVELVARKGRQALQALEDAALRVADREQRARDSDQRGESSLLQRRLASLTPEEVDRMRAAVRRLAERLKARLSRRRKVRRRGQLSVRRTLRKNLVHGGILASLVFRSRKRERPEVVVLCDVSDSVRNVSRLMLQFVYTLQSLYSRVRSFVFVSDLGEVTHLFREADVAEAVDLATAGRVVNLAANSNYGHALQLFCSTHLGAVGRRTTVLVIGDGRTNYNPPNAWALLEIKRRCRRLLWLCPEDPSSWGFGDSEMPLYARHCHRVDAVRSVEDLTRVAAQILP